MFLVGYNTSVLNPVSPYCFPSHSTMEWSFAVSAFAVGGPLGSAMAGTVSGRLGVKSALQLTLLMFLSSGVLQTFAQDVLGLTVSRALAGLASGSSTVLVPLYLGEISPPTIRGTLGTVTQFSMVIGILFSNVAALALENGKKWRTLFSVTFFVAGSCFVAARGWVVER